MLLYVGLKLVWHNTKMNGKTHFNDVKILFFFAQNDIK